MGNKKTNDKISWKSFILWLLIIIILIAVAIVIVQPSLFFYPWHDEKSYAKLKTMNEFEEFTIQNGNETIHGWIRYENIEEKNIKKPLIVMFGGNAQNSSNTCMWFHEAEIFNRFLGYNFLIIDYPEYGLSTGRVSEKTLFSTGIKTYEYAESLPFTDKENIVVMGFSIGTGVATYVSSEKNPNGLILLAPYDEALSLYNNTLNIFYGPMRLLTLYKLESIKYAKEIETKPLIITSTGDEVISYKLSENLSKNFKNSSEYMCVEGTDHNAYFSREDVLTRIEEYLKNKLEKEN